MAIPIKIRRNPYDNSWEHWVPATADNDGFWSPGLYDSNRTSVIPSESIRRNVDGYLLSYEEAVFPEYKLESSIGLITYEDWLSAFDLNIFELVPVEEKDTSEEPISPTITPLQVSLQKSLSTDPDLPDIQYEELNVPFEEGYDHITWLDDIPEAGTLLLIVATIRGGTIPYAIEWTGPNGIIDTSNPNYALNDYVIYGLRLGEYTIRVTDKEGYVVDANIVVRNEDYIKDYEEHEGGGSELPQDQLNYQIEPDPGSVVIPPEPTFIQGADEGN